MRGLRVLLISYYDFAGSGHRIAEAVNLTTNNFVLPFNLLDMPYPSGLPRVPALVAEYDTKRIVSQSSLDRLQALIDNSDVIHFKGDDLPTRELPGGVLIPEGKPIILTVNGSFFRRGLADSVSMGKVPLVDYVEATNMRTAGDPTLLYPEYDGTWTPMPVDIKRYPDHSHRWSDTFVIAHSPSDENKKGTQKIIDAVRLLDGNDIELKIIKNVSYTEAVKLKSSASMFIDQTEAGFYGNAGLEAMAYGVPTMTYLVEGSFPPTAPVLNCGTTVDEIRDSILCAYKVYQDKNTWNVLSDRTKSFVSKIHSYEVVGPMWEDIYRRVLFG